MPEQVLIRNIMSSEESKVWYESNTKHYDSVTQRLASGLPGKSGRYFVTILGEKNWIFYSLLFSPSRGYIFTTNGQILARREYFENQGIMLIASDTEPMYIKDIQLILPSGYRQKVRVSYCHYDDLNILRFKKRRND